MKRVSFLQLLAISVILSLITIVLFLTFTDKKEIETTEVENAEKIFGLKFTLSERDSMLDNLIEYRNGYKSNWKVEMENSVVPSLLFNPLPIGFEFNKEQKPLCLLL